MVQCLDSPRWWLLLCLALGVDEISRWAAEPKAMALKVYGPIQSIQDIFVSSLRKRSWAGNHFSAPFIPSAKVDLHVRTFQPRGITPSTSPALALPVLLGMQPHPISPSPTKNLVKCEGK